MENCKRIIPALLMLALYSGIALYTLNGYLHWDSPGFLLGLLAVPLVIRGNRQQRRSLRFYYAALVFCMLAWIIPVKTFLFFAIVMALCFVADNVFGKINLLPVLVLLLMSPLFTYFTNIFTFPIRLELTDAAGRLLQLTGASVNVAGNAIIYNGQEFSVDAACMGLSMLVTSLLCGIMMLGMMQRKLGVSITWPKVLLLLGGIVVMNVISNLFRILLLVQFSILPEDPMHGITGILCLLVYVILPLIWLTPRLVQRYGKAADTRPAYAEKSRFILAQAHLSLAACIFLAGYKMVAVLPVPVAAITPPVVAGYAVTGMPGQVTKLENKDALVYVKRISDFYYTDHHPTICWQGSGYAFRQVKEDSIAGHTLFTGMLQKGEEQLYTAWWYDNGAGMQTISQLAWRWNALSTRQRFAVVNVTAQDRASLELEIRRVLATHAVKACM